MTILKKTAADILAEIKQLKLDRERAAANSNSQIGRVADTDRASIKGERGDHIFCDPAAHLLSTISREKLLNRCAPMGADNASSEVAYSANQDGEKSHAAFATTASEEALNSLHSSNYEDEVVNGCANDAPADDDAENPALADPNFYEIKTDLFDNSGNGKKSTQHRAKLMIRAEPTTTAKDADVFMLDFYNRSRDINKRLKEMEVDEDEWYSRFKAEFQRREKELVAYEIAPKLAVLKEIIKEDGSSEVIGYAAGIMFKVQNQEPTVILFYGGNIYTLALDLEFNRTAGSAIYKKGIWRDADRQHMDVELTSVKKKFKIKTKKDFS